MKMNENEISNQLRYNFAIYLLAQCIDINTVVNTSYNNNM